jgi:hypothetical protein
MPSTFTWIDHSEEQKRKALDLVAALREPGTVDELGLGTIRDAIADRLFPATAAPMTQARYFLFVPWMYRMLEDKATPSREMARRCRSFEIELIKRLLASGETIGVIGRRATDSLDRTPAGIYWSGLGRLGIRSWRGSQEAYYRSLDGFYSRRRLMVRNDDGETEGVESNWHLALPEPPPEFSNGGAIGLEMTPGERAYLGERVRYTAPRSLFAFLIDDRSLDVARAQFPWDLQPQGGFGDSLERELRHARNFSEVMHGAGLLYNLLLARLARSAGHRETGGRVDEYGEKLTAWSGLVKSKFDELSGWPRSDFWHYVREHGARVRERTEAFVEAWCRLVLDERGYQSLADSDEAARLLRAREVAIKGAALARLVDRRALERWGGASGSGQLSYRWPNAQRILADLHGVRKVAVDA